MLKTCDTCNGRGEIGGFVNMENGYQTDPCPSCENGTIMLDVSPFTDAQWYKMCSLDMSLPVPLHHAAVSKPFVYDRKWGVFYVPNGHHQSAMALLLAFRNGFDDITKYRQALGLSTCYLTVEMADQYLTLEGTAFRSSQGSSVMAFNPQLLNHTERRLLGSITYLSNKL